jgi:hypothetical protein
MSSIDDKYKALGGPQGFLGVPLIHEIVCPDGIGHYRHGMGDSSAELYCITYVKANDIDMDVGSRRPSGHTGSSFNLSDYGAKFKINPIRVNTKIWFKVEFFDWDQSSENDWLGTYYNTLDITTLWGLDNGNQGVFSQMPMLAKGGDAPSLNSVRISFAILQSN